jgi:putative ABC transport system permease protein
MDALRQELRQAVRRLVRSPAFTLASVLTLALAIAANASIFTVVQRVVLNPLSYPDSDRLIELSHGAVRLNLPTGLGVTRGLYYQYADRSQTLAGIALYNTDDMTLTGDGEPIRIRIARTSPSLASVLRVSPLLGRWFTDAEGKPGGGSVAVLSYGLWLRRYGGDRGIVGHSLVLAGVSRDVVGVMPASFAFPDPGIDAWLAEPIDRAMGFGIWTYNAVGRLRDGATLSQARADLNGLIADVPHAFADDRFASANTSEIQLFATPRTLKEATIGNVARGLWILLASVGLVLLIACANVANLLLVRSEARQREVAVRRALGASGAVIGRYFLAESIVLAAVGGGLGLGLAASAVRLLVATGPPNLPRLAEIHIDGVVIAFTAALIVMAAIACGLIPWWHGAATAAPLHDSGRSNTASRGRNRARQLLMGAQIALALVLLIASGLLIRSFQKLRAVDPGFDASSALTFSIGLPDREYNSVARAVSAHHAIGDRLRVLPGVTAVSASTCLPLAGGCFGNTVRVQGRAYPAGTIPPVAMFRAVAGGYFETMGMRVLRGRGIDRGDVERREPIVVVDEAFANRVFPNQNPIGEHVASNRPPADRGLDWLTIVGIVSKTPIRALAETDPLPQLFMPMSIAGGPGIPMTVLVGPNVSVMSYVVRTASSPAALLPAVRRAIDGVDSSLALARVSTLQETLNRASAQTAFTMALLAIAAGVALALGLVGVYGVMSYIVSLRTVEIGVRLALGAAPHGIATMIVKQGAVVALAGMTAGLGLTVAGSRVIESLLYGISPRDPVVFATTTLVLAGAALAACWLPARRAASLSPIEALRSE